MTSNTVVLDETGIASLEIPVKQAVGPEAKATNSEPEAICNAQSKLVEDESKEKTLLNGERDSSSEKEDISGTGETPKASVKEEELTEEEKLKLRIGRLHSDREGYNQIVNQRVWESINNPEDAIETQFAIIQYGSRGTQRLEIFSPYIQKVFNAVVKYYPTIAYEKTSISFMEPYAPLFHYYSEMCEYAANDTPDPLESSEEFKILKLFYESQLASSHDKVRAALALKTVQFDHLWALYCPGEVLYTRDEFDQEQLYSIVSGGYKRPEISGGFNRGPEKPWRYCVDGWFTTWDASSKKFTRSLKASCVDVFEGTRNITSLACYPLKYHKDDQTGELGKLQQSLEARGNAWKRLVSSPSCQQYMGMAQQYDYGPLKEGDRRYVALNGRIIVDQEDEMIQAFFNSEQSEDQEAKIRPMNGTDHDDRYLEFDNQLPDKPFESLQAQLCPSVLRCISLQDQKWYKIVVDRVSTPVWSKSAYDHLVLDEKLKTMLRGLVENHRRNKTKVMRDVIDKKGQGLVVVLHGPPGVGKTLTAETVADLTEKPLYQININDVVNDRGIHDSLQASFNRASRWDAVVLLDEADVLLEKRSFEDLGRNAVVSVFLRTLEYYEGILFMTTNRLRTMDPAFKSRVHIAVRYKDFMPQQRRRIWSNFIDLLDDSESQAKEEMRDHLDDMQEWELNGRQIRNVIMIAQSLALSTQRMRGTLRFHHIENVARQTIDFQHFFDEDEKSSRSLLDTVPNRRFREFTSR